MMNHFTKWKLVSEMSAKITKRLKSCLLNIFLLGGGVEFKTFFLTNISCFSSLSS